MRRNSIENEERKKKVFFSPLLFDSYRKLWRRKVPAMMDNISLNIKERT